MKLSSKIDTSKNINHFIYILDRNKEIPCFVNTINVLGKEYQEVGMAYKKDNVYIIKRKDTILISSIDKTSFHQKCLFRNLEFITSSEYGFGK